MMHRFSFAGGHFARAIAVAVSLALASAAAAMPPVDYTLDGLGVDLKSGSFNLSRQVISIGPAGAPDLLSLAVAYNSQETRIGPISPGWSHSQEIRARREVEDGATVVRIIAGMSVVKFTESGGSYTPDRRNGDALIGMPSDGFGDFQYRTRDGVLMSFSPSNNTSCADPAQACDYHARMVEKPDGEILSYSYTASGSPSGAFVVGNLMSVNSSLGWNLSFAYNGSNRLASVRAVNRAEAFCPDAYFPAQPHCTQSDWPSVTVGYDGNLRLTSITDSQGKTRRVFYNSAGRLSATRRPASTGNDRSISYDSAGRVTSQSITILGSWSYDITADQGSVTDPLGGQETVFFGDSSRPQWMEDALGRRTTFAYDEFDRLVEQTTPEDDSVRLIYDARGNVTETRRIARPGSGLADIVTRAGFPASCPAAEAARCNKPLWREDALGNRTDFTYEQSTGLPLTVTAPADDSGVRAQQRMSYQSVFAWLKTSSGGFTSGPAPVRRLVETAACATQASCAGTADEVKTTFGYGASGVANNRALRRVTQDPGGLSIISKLTYDRIGNLLTSDGPLAGGADTTRMRYDSERRVIGAVGPDPDGSGPLRHPASRTEYDDDGFAVAAEAGTVTGQSDSAWAAFSVETRSETLYDRAGRPVRERAIADGGVQSLVQMSYDGAGRLECTALRMNPAAYSDPPSSACSLGPAGVFGPDRISKRVYDAAGQVVQTISGLGTVLEQVSASMSYTANGQLAGVTTARGHVTEMVYDGFGRLAERRFPDPLAAGASSPVDFEAFVYDAAGRVTLTERRDGQVVSFAYDALGRLTARDLSGTAADDVAIAYDLLGRAVQTVKGDGGSIVTSHDRASRVVSMTADGRTLTYGYDPAGRRTSMTWPDGFSVTYDRDTLGRMTAIRENGGAVLASFAFDDAVSLLASSAGGRVRALGYPRCAAGARSRLPRAAPAERPRWGAAMGRRRRWAMTQPRG